MLAWLAAGAALLVSSCTDAQMCNSEDPDGGGLLVGSLGAGSRRVCLNTEDDPAYYNSTALYPNGTALCENLKTVDTCRAAGMTLDPIKSQCKWEDTCLPRDVVWGCDCEEFVPSGALECKANPDGDPQLGNAMIYCVLLLWSFMGVGIIADVFMEAIAVITSSSTLVEKKDWKTGEKQQLHIMAWNATVANLTLMALGSSAPEILLSVIEIVTSKPSPCFSGALGPSTIVGSAAFNMLVILGICTICIPTKNEEEGETGMRAIADTNVFAITAFSSIFAYVWLLVILLVISPNVVDFGEALLTFLFFPILVTLAFMADKGYFSKTSAVAPAPVSHIVGTQVVGGDMTTFRPSEVKNMLKQDGHRSKLKEDPEVLAREAYFRSKPKTRADRRIEATRAMTGSKPLHESIVVADSVNKRSWVGFQCIDYLVNEKEEEVKLSIERSGCTDDPVTLTYTTLQTTTEGADKVGASGSITFQQGEVFQHVLTKVLTDNKVFKVQLSEVSDSNCELSRADTGYENDWSLAHVTIEEGGTMADACKVAMAETLEEQKDGHSASYKCFESDGRVLIKLTRAGSCTSACTVKFSTKEGTATGDLDYETKEGTVTFEVGQASQSVEIVIIDDDNYESDEDFTVSIFEPKGCDMGGLTTAIITIVNDDEMTDTIERVAKLFALNLDKYRAGGASWKAQFVDAVTLPLETSDKITHFINLPWKVLFAFCPPPGLMGGWLCFVLSLGLIGVVTGLIGDLAGHFGCSVGMKDEVTAITFVALGTSLPDTFASMAAAVGDKTADASIGNVTGSNSVNVFLGLGLPWLIAAVYWGMVTNAPTDQTYIDWLDYMYVRSGLSLTEIKDIEVGCGGSPCFVVPAGSLAFSVMVFAGCGIVCLGSLVLRRKLYGAELGGQAKYPFGVFFICLWFLYVSLSTMKSYAVF